MIANKPKRRGKKSIILLFGRTYPGKDGNFLHGGVLPLPLFSHCGFWVNPSVRDSEVESKQTKRISPKDFYQLFNHSNWKNIQMVVLHLFFLTEPVFSYTTILCQPVGITKPHHRKPAFGSEKSKGISKSRLILESDKNPQKPLLRKNLTDPPQVTPTCGGFRRAVSRALLAHMDRFHLRKGSEKGKDTTNINKHTVVSNISYFHREMIQFGEHIFQMGGSTTN